MLHSLSIYLHTLTQRYPLEKINRRCRAANILLVKAIFLLSLATLSALEAFAQAGNQVSTVTPPPKAIEDIIPLVNQFCGSCHKVPHPNVLPKISWPRVIENMATLAEQRMGRTFISAEHIRDITAFYYGSSAETLQLLPYIDNPSESVIFSNQSIVMQAQIPLIFNINAVDLGSGTEFLVCDGASKQLLRLRHSENGWQQTALAEFDLPIHTQVVDYDGDGLLDTIVVDLGVFLPTGDLAGKIYLLRQLKSGQFEKQLLLNRLGRATDARALDLDGDGDLDLAVAIFGGGEVGEIFWMENLGNNRHKKHMLLNLSGALNISPADINGDGKIDLISLVAQEHEMIVAFVNDGEGAFKTEIISRAPHPMFGSTSMQPVDLDGDGDVDILFTNGDAFDYQSDPKPYHGVQWLENRGDLKFQFHNIGRFYGAATAVVADVDLDGDLDIVASSWLNHWDDDKRQTLVWFENNGKQQFVPRPISTEPNSIVTLVLQDLNGDGRPDIIAGSLRIDDAAKAFSTEDSSDKSTEKSSAAKSLLPSLITLDNLSLKGSSNQQDN